MDKTIAHYRIIEKIGAGGMGDVFLAEDTRLDRRVALKFLPDRFASNPDALARFKREAKSAAALRHPNIVTIFDIGRHDEQSFIAMEYIEGDRLSDVIARDDLTIERAIDIATQVCDALEEAHGAGIIHRDIKPDNILFDKAGRVKLADFGLATGTQMTKITQEGTTVGTVHYMSPEQVRGEDVDPNSDLFSLGAILYEMVTRQMAFPGEHHAAITYAVTSVDPQPLSRFNNRATPELERIVSKGLMKDPTMRYHSAADLRTDLRQLTDTIGSATAASSTRPAPARSRARVPVIVGAVVAMVVVAFLAWQALRNPQSDLSTGMTPGDDRPSVAVLPLENLSGDPNEEYFADGMTETLITSLAQIGGLRVISRTSVMQYKDTIRSIPEIAAKLGVTTVVEGSVMRIGNEVRVTAQLIDGRTDEHLWAQNYDREMKSVLVLQSDVARAIADEIHVVLTPAEHSRLAAVPNVNPDAYNAYLRGLTDWNRRDEEDLRAALGHFRQAIEIDPDYAQAHAALANTYVIMGHWGYEPLELTFDIAEAEARKALELDPNLAQAYAALAAIKHERDLDVTEARRLFKKAIELAPGFASAHQWLGEVELYLGNYDIALGCFSRALDLDPASLIIRLAHAASVATVVGCGEGFGLLDGVVADYPDSDSPKAYAGFMALACGDYERMAREFTAFNFLFPWTEDEQRDLEGAWHDGELKGFSATYARLCEEHVAGGGRVPTGWILVFYATAQDWDAVFANLDKAYAEAGPWAFSPLWFKYLFTPIADDQRYQAYVTRLTTSSE